MDCDTCREALSARLDGETPPAPAERVEHHLAGCSACRSWEQRARDLSRTLRVRPVRPVPDVSRSVVRAAAARRSRPVRWLSVRWRRVLLACVAVCQIALGVAQVPGLPGSHHGDRAERALTAGHLFNESTAWNIALGLGLLWCAYRVRASAGLVPVLSAFLAVLTGFCVVDFANGAVSVPRLAAHGLLVLGLVCLLLVHRGTARRRPRSAGEAEEDGVPVDFDDAQRGGPAAEADAHRHGPLPPAGLRRAG
ncbi:zf-HC2 domain-containing protein [Bounagaea algeriensis]